MGPPSYLRSVVDRNVVMRRMTIHVHTKKKSEFWLENYALNALIVRSTTPNDKNPQRRRFVKTT